MQHWSNYWQYSGVVNSFAEGSEKHGYSGDLKKFWEATLADAPSGATIVDLGTGNGSLAMLASEYGITEQKDFVVHGVDAAAIDPLKALEREPTIAKKLKGITFHSETPMENLPFDDGKVDLMVSQFAFEYADTKKALESALSALKDGGQLTVMAHHPKSSIVLDSKAGIEVLDNILEESPLFQLSDLYVDIAKQVIPQLGDDWNNFAHNRILTRSIQWMMQELQEKFSKDTHKVWVNDVVSRIGRVMQVLNGENLDQCRQEIAAQYHLLNDHRLRLKDQEQAAMAKKDITALKKTAEAAGAKFSAEEFKLNGEIFGWAIKVSK